MAKQFRTRANTGATADEEPAGAAAAAPVVPPAEEQETTADTAGQADADEEEQAESEPTPRADRPVRARAGNLASSPASRTGRNGTPRTRGRAAGAASTPAGIDVVDLVAALAPAPLDPDLDLVPLNVKVPRYVFEALDMVARLSAGREGGRKQDMVAEALRRFLPDDIVGQNLNRAYQRLGHSDER